MVLVAIISSPVDLLWDSGGDDGVTAGVDRKVPLSPVGGILSIWLSRKDIFSLGMYWTWSTVAVSLLTLFAEAWAAETTEMPSAWFWGDVEGRSYLTRLQTEHAPQYCRSSWAAATASALSDRLKIHRPEIQPAVTISTQVLLNCATSDGCSGGEDPLSALEYIKEKGIPDETCQAYAGEEGVCDDLGICRDCKHGNVTAGQDFFKDQHCFPRHDYPVYGLSDFGILRRNAIPEEVIPMIKRMKEEIYTQGTITCGIHPSLEFQNYKDGILSHGSPTSNHTHYVNIVGWDVTVEPKYWIVRNCWGEMWGIGGYFKIEMGINALGIEEFCYWGQPTPFPANNHLPDPMEESELETSIETDCSCLPSRGMDAWPVYRVSRPDIKNVEIPDAYDVRNITGRSYATLDKNQHIPTYCGSCSYFASMSALADRFARLYDDVPPLFDIANQALINCAGDGCEGAWPMHLYEYMLTDNIPHESCAPYCAVNEDCNVINTCKTCNENGNCSSIPAFSHWGFGVQDHGSIIGRESIKWEIATSGPISCVIASTAAFREYKGGIFNDTEGGVRPNHALMVGGWGTEDGIDYWIVRNSWGRYWGEDGWGRIAMGSGEMQLSSVICDWATPRPFKQPMPYRTLLRPQHQT